VENPSEFADALVGLDRSLLAEEFLAATDDDLRTVAIQYLVRKPSSV
jgi:hypothetical protein